MSKLWLLIKINLINQLKLNKLFGRKDMATKLVILLLVVFVSIIAFGYMLTVYFDLTMLAQEASLDVSGILTLGLFGSSAFLMITSLSRANAYLFKTRDFDLLVSMPLPLATIVFSKILSFLLVSYIPVFFIFIPSVVVYAFFAATNALFYILVLLVFLLLPLLLIAVFSFVSYLLATLIAKFKYKNALSIIFQFVLFLGVMFFTLMLPTNQASPNLFSEIEVQMKYLYFPGYLAKVGLVGNYLYLLYFFFLSVIPFALFVWLTGKHYVALNTKLSASGPQKQVLVKTNTRSQGQFMTLLLNETRRFFAIPLVVVNTLTGKLLMPILIVVFYFSFQSASMESIPAIDAELMSLLVLGVAVFAVGTTAISTSSLSLEGKKFWILKGSPVSFSTITLSKISLDVIFTAVFLLPTVILAIILLKVNVYSMFLVALAVLIFGLHTALFGYILNLKMPRMDFDTPVKVVKQSAAVTVQVFASFILLGLMFILGLGVYIMLVESGNNMLTASNVVIGTIALFSLLLVGIELLILKVKGPILFSKIQA